MFLDGLADLRLFLDTRIPVQFDRCHGFAVETCSAKQGHLLSVGHRARQRPPERAT